MKQFDVFNGDADGICALQQMRLAYPVDAELITGIKRNIQLVKNVNAESGDQVLVLDVSLAKNIEAVNELLAKSCKVQYFDHHLTGELPESELFKAFVNASPDTCTSLLVNEYLNHKHVYWAITGAYGDNMVASAEKLAEQEKLTKVQRSQLKELGICLNYNGYGASLDDLHFEPAALYQTIKPYVNPFDFINREPAFKILVAGYQDDMREADSLQPDLATSEIAVFMLPAKKWCRRVSGVLGNDLSNQFPERAHALLTEIEAGNFQVSVRAPQNNKTGAGTLCSQFETGGGREGAAGINLLPAKDKQKFIDEFMHLYTS